MDIQRAEQILASSSIINVTHNGQSVWIDQVDATSQTATVHAANNPSDTRTVSLNQLMEM